MRMGKANPPVPLSGRQCPSGKPDDCVLDPR